MIQSNKTFFKNRSGIISLQRFSKLRIVMAQMIVRNDAARKSQMFCKLYLILIDQEKENTSIIMIQSTFRMHKICSQHKKIILFIIYIYRELCKTHCCTKRIRVSNEQISSLLVQQEVQVLLKSMMNFNRQNSYEKELENGGTICNMRLNVLNKICYDFGIEQISFQQLPQVLLQ